MKRSATKQLVRFRLDFSRRCSLGPRDARLNVTAAEDTLRLTRGRKQLGVGTVLEDILQ